MKNVARINNDDYFAEGSKVLWERKPDLYELLLRLTLIQGGIQDWIEEHDPAERNAEMKQRKFKVGDRVVKRDEQKDLSPHKDER